MTALRITPMFMIGSRRALHVIERNLLGAKVELGGRVEIYSGVARLAATVWASELRPRDVVLERRA